MGPRSAAVGWGGTHAGGSAGAVGGAPYGATKRCTGWVKMPNWASGAHAGDPTGSFGGAPYGATKRYWVGEIPKLDVRDACGRFH
eukprot:681523-Pyramimonas_sp.AAC.1